MNSSPLGAEDGRINVDAGSERATEPSQHERGVAISPDTTFLKQMCRDREVGWSTAKDPIFQEVRAALISETQPVGDGPPSTSQGSTGGSDRGGNSQQQTAIPLATTFQGQGLAVDNRPSPPLPNIANTGKQPTRSGSPPHSEGSRATGTTKLQGQGLAADNRPGPPLPNIDNKGKQSTRSGSPPHSESARTTGT